MDADNQDNTISIATETREQIRNEMRQQRMLLDQDDPIKPPIRLGLIMNTYSLLIAILPIIVVVFIALNLFSSQARDQAVNQMTSIALLKSREIDAWLAASQVTLDLALTNPDQYRRMRDIIESPGLPGVAGRNVTNFLQNQLNMQSAFEEYFLYNLDGVVRISTSPDQVNNDLIRQGQPYVADSLNIDLAGAEGTSASMIHPAYYDYFTAKVNVIITQPLYNDITGGIVGVLAGRLSTDALAEIMTTRDGLGETGETYLVSSEFSNLITPSRFIEYDPARRQTSAGISQGLSGQRGSAFYPSYRGEDVIGVFRWIPALEAALIAEIAEDEALSAVRDVRNVSTVVAIVTSILALVVGQGITRWITRPIAKLHRVTQAVMRGDYSERANLTVITEIGQLGRAFDTMTTELVQAINERNVRIKQAEELSESLEMRVRSRTRDLQVAALVARQITTVLDLKELLSQVVALTATSFDLYACQIHTLDEENAVLRLDASGGAEGAISYKPGEPTAIPLHAQNSVIAQAARKGEIVVVNDTQESDLFSPGQTLTETRSQLAIPLKLGHDLLGVFDLHAQEAERFGQEDITALTTLAEQISVAIQNAQLFSATREAQAEAERANRVKSQFLANMSHELRTPLNAILNFTEFVADGLLGEVNEEQISALNKALESGEHLLSLINDILDLTKIEVGMMELFMENVDLNRMLESVLMTAKGLVSEKPAVTIDTDIAPELPTLQGDKRRIRQIILNLISNAVKFTPSGCITVAAQPDDDGILLSVADTGVGIPPNAHELIFESFRQSDNVRVVEAGTGLGLPITRHLVEAHGGQIWLESEIDKGSTFYVRLPIQQTESPAR